MHTVTLDGVGYNKATEVAKQFGYTSDYLGQLCRAKKVNARLVGRSWYVNVPSLEKHRSERYAKSKNPTSDSPATKEIERETSTDIPIKKYLKRVSPPHASLRRIQQGNDSQSSFDKSFTTRYESDEGALLPHVQSSPKVTLLKVSVADSEKLDIESVDAKERIMRPSELPDVALSGSVSVSTVPDPEPEEVEQSPAKEEVSKNKSFSRDKFINKVTIRQESDKSDNERTDKKSVHTEKVQTYSQIKSKKSTALQKTSPEEKNTSVQIQNLDTESNLINNAQAVLVTESDSTIKIVPIEFKLPALGVVAGVVVGLFFLSAEQILTVINQTTDFEISFVWSNVKNLASVLFTG